MAVDIVDSNEVLYQHYTGRAAYHKGRAEWELAQNCLHDAQSLCEQHTIKGAEARRLDILIELADVSRRHGQYQQAIDAHLQALSSPGIDGKRKIEILGELGVNYRHMDDLHNAKLAFQTQYDESRKDGDYINPQTCRAAGNLGMVLYQSWLTEHQPANKHILQRAIALLEQRVDMARKIRDTLEASDPLGGKLLMWEQIGLCRLSLAETANGNTSRGVEYARLALDMVARSADPTVNAMTRFFYGYALLQHGDTESAAAQLNLNKGVQGRCTPLIALCKEPSRENREYVGTLISQRVDLMAWDEHGYSALDYATYSNDHETTNMLLEAMVASGAVAPAESVNLRNASLLRKHFRDVFHLRFRSILNSGRGDCISTLRSTYQEMLAQDEAKRARFDDLRVLKLAEFKTYRELPYFHRQDRSAQLMRDVSRTSVRSPFLIFVSYRWIGTDDDPSVTTAPDDSHNTQYKRIVGALDAFIARHTDVDTESVYVWLDRGCIDQEDFEPGRRERGINALPIVLAQCNAMISLVDDLYFTRAWCGVELLIIQTLRNSNPEVYKWYEHRLDDPKSSKIRGRLIEGRARELKPSSLNVSVASDLRYIQFLERQSLLLKQIR